MEYHITLLYILSGWEKFICNRRQALMDFRACLYLEMFLCLPFGKDC